MNKNSGGKTSSPWKFFGLTFLLTWACWLPAGWLPVGQYGVLNMILHYVGGLMPALVALSLLYLYGDHQGRRNYWRRLIDFNALAKPGMQ